MDRPPLITLLTDFGHSDPFVGILHGVILAECPSAQIVDLCHELAPQDVLSAAFWTARCHRWFPAGTLHVVVVDPGVGTQRRALALGANGQIYLAPDNGVLSALLEAPGAVPPRQIDTVRLGLPEPSRTFHGRDLFAPVAGRLASGALTLDEVGELAGELQSIGGLRATRSGEEVLGEVVTLDRFGNLLSNVTVEDVGAGAVEITVGNVCARQVATYAEGRPGEPVALLNSFGVLEFAVRDAHAGRALGLGRGAPVRLRRRVGTDPDGRQS